MFPYDEEDENNQLPSAQDITGALQGQQLVEGEQSFAQPDQAPQSPDAGYIQRLRDVMNQYQQLVQKPPEAKDPELEGALADRRSQMRNLAILKSAATIGNSIAGSAGGQYVADRPDEFKTQEQMASLGMDELKAKRESGKEKLAERKQGLQEQMGLAKGEMELSKQERQLKIDAELDNPASATSQFYRDMAKQQYPKLAGQISDKLSARNIMKLKLGPSGASDKGTFQNAYYVDEKGNTGSYKFDTRTGEATPMQGLSKAFAAQVRQDPRSNELIAIQPGAPGSQPTQVTGPATGATKAEKKDLIFDDLNPKQRDELKEIEKEYRADVKDSVEFGETLSGLNDLINADISAAIPVIRRQLARSVGREVGVMTDQDVNQFSGDQSFVGALERFAKLKATGKMTDRDKQQYGQIISIAQNNIRKAMDNRASYHSTRLGQRVPNASDSSLKQLLSVEQSKPSDISYPQEVLDYAAKHSMTPDAVMKLAEKRKQEQMQPKK